jgi:hypothetical protein
VKHSSQNSKHFLFDVIGQKPTKFALIKKIYVQKFDGVEEQGDKSKVKLKLNEGGKLNKMERQKRKR